MKVGRHVVFHLGRYRATDPYERCGVILLENGIVHFVELPNRHPTPRRQFSIHAGDIKTALRARLSAEPTVLGFFHTHPGEDSIRRPSTRDLYAASRMAREYIHAMYHPHTDTLVWYDRTGIIQEEKFTHPRTAWRS